uniref:RING-type domain-containing protein n=1 Tax=Acrobeloides nanus TaxID=290746 RepID=A0A914C0R1_9BILA
MTSDKCTVCQDALESSPVTTDCNHSFHKECFVDYLENARRINEYRWHDTDDELRSQLDMNVNCPVCRKPIDEEKYAELEKEVNEKLKST